MAIPRRLIFVAAGAIATAGYIFVRNKLDADQREKADREREFRRGPRPVPNPTVEKPADNERNDDPRADERADMPGGERELSEFLAGDAWFDEAGWKSIWGRENIEDAKAWLKSQGLETLRRERGKLRDHPALLAGCRRRWIVVARYAEIDVSDAAELWNKTE